MPLAPSLRVLMTTDTVGGVWSTSLELIRALEPAGVRFVLATMGRRLTGDQWADVSALRNVAVHESEYLLEWMEDPWDDVARAGDWLMQLAAETQCDVVHLNGYAHAALPWQVPVLVAAHSCVVSWWHAVKGEAPPESWDRYRSAVREGLEAADLIVTPSRAMLDDLKACHSPAISARVIPNARNSRQYYPRVKSPYVFTAGRLWDEAKNSAALLAVAPELPWPVIMAGEGVPNSAGAGVKFLGRITSAELRPWLGRASIYALPSRYEPFGLSVLEAALSGAALVLGDIPSMRENWDDVAFFVDPDDPDELRRTLEHVISHAEVRRAYGVRARLRALNFNEQTMAAAYLESYRQLMSGMKRMQDAPFDPLAAG